MCNCLDETTQSAIDLVSVKLRGRQTIKEINIADSGYVNRALTFGKNGGWRLIFPIEVKYTPFLKDGSVGKEKTYKTNMFPSFCPFCGNTISNE